MLDFLRRDAKTGDEKVASFASALLAENLDDAPLLRAFENAARSNKFLEKTARALRMSGSADYSELQKIDNGHLVELVRIVSSGVRNGAGVRRALELFRDRLEREISSKNRFRAKAGSSMALTYMGMCIFFPLFSGISSVILGSSVGDGELTRGFLAVSMLYPLIILCISSAFLHPERRISRNLLSAAPYFALASVITLATSNYLSGML
ncbi:MAG: hypothetical protein KGH57_02270 [Candidatus Micrarchaeota archaeon]|nr:hypothetical protein [Candidatus Micrarchaeota archaeon]